MTRSSRAFATPRAASAVRLMDSLGLLDVLLPEVAAGRGVTQPKEHYYDVLEHNIETVAALDWMLAEDAPADVSERDFHGVALGGARRRAAPARLPAVRRSAKVALGRRCSSSPACSTTWRSRRRARRTRPDAFASSDTRTSARRLPEGSCSACASAGARLSSSRTMIDAHLRPGQLGQDGPPTRRAMFRFFRDTGRGCGRRAAAQPCRRAGRSRAAHDARGLATGRGVHRIPAVAAATKMKQSFDRRA